MGRLMSRGSPRPATDWGLFGLPPISNLQRRAAVRHRARPNKGKANCRVVDGERSVEVERH